MSSESAADTLPPECRALFQILDPWEVEVEVERAEAGILQKLDAAGGFIPTGIEIIDYLVDQVRFLKAALADAEERGLQGLPALEWAAYLSWPATQRLAETQWRRDLVRRYAFETPTEWWQRALQARQPDDPVNEGPSRDANWFPSMLQFGPYPSTRHPTKLAPATLEAHIRFDPWTTPGPLAPVRRLNRVLTWQLQVSVARLYRARFGAMDIVIDEPRKYSAEEARMTLLERATHLESLLRSAERDPSEVPPEVVAQWRQGIELLQTAAGRIGRGTRDRATLLELCFSVPGRWWFGPVEILTDDLPPEWLGVMLGFAFDRRGLLSVRDGKLLRKVAAAVFNHSQSTRYPDHEVSPKTTQRVITRLRHVRRLLQPSSLFKYVARLTRRRHR